MIYICQTRFSTLFHHQLSFAEWAPSGNGKTGINNSTRNRDLSQSLTWATAFVHSIYLLQLKWWIQLLQQSAKPIVLDIIPGAVCLAASSPSWDNRKALITYCLEAPDIENDGSKCKSEKADRKARLIADSSQWSTAWRLIWDCALFKTFVCNSEPTLRG